MHCSSKVKNKFKKIMLCSHLLEYFNIFFFFFFFLLLSHFYPLLLSPQSSHSSFLPVASTYSSTHHQPKPLPNTDHSLHSLPLSLSLYYLIFPLLCLSIFLCLKHQDSWSPMLDFDFVAVIDKTTLLPWLGFVNGFIFILMNRFWFCWWLMNRFCWWLMNGFCW